MPIVHPAFAGLYNAHRQHARRVAVIAVLITAACGGDGYNAPTESGDPGGPPVAAATVQATPAERFTPASVNLTVGGTVTFQFGTLAHNLFFDNAPAGAPQNIVAATSNQSVTRTFATAGRYVYNCHLHPGMTGTVTVQ